MSDNSHHGDGTIWPNDVSKHLNAPEGEVPFVVGTLNFHDGPSMMHALKAVEYYRALWHLEEAIRRMVRGKEPTDLERLLDMIPGLEE